MIETFEEIERRRDALGVKVSAVARVAGIAPSTYGRISRGEVRPLAETLGKLSRALDLMEEWEDGF